MADQSPGRPLKFKSAKELQKKIDEYFESCFEEWWYQDKQGNWHQNLDRNGEPLKIQKRPFTISGLALHLGTSRQTLINYEEKQEYFDTIKNAKARIENYTEEQLFNAEAKNMTGIIFNLKNNYGQWADKQELEHSGDVAFVVNRKRVTQDDGGDN
jgi:hypothetical protein